MLDRENRRIRWVLHYDDMWSRLNCVTRFATPLTASDGKYSSGSVITAHEAYVSTAWADSMCVEAKIHEDG